jgi:hypothetical protein
MVLFDAEALKKLIILMLLRVSIKYEFVDDHVSSFYGFICRCKI